MRTIDRALALFVVTLVGVLAAAAGCGVLVVGGYEADLNPGSVGVNVAGWLLLAAGAGVALTSTVALVVMVRRARSSR